MALSAGAVAKPGGRHGAVAEAGPLSGATKGISHAVAHQ